MLLAGYSVAITQFVCAIASHAVRENDMLKVSVSRIETAMLPKNFRGRAINACSF
jgi:hypothetical protein